MLSQHRDSLSEPLQKKEWNISRLVQQPRGSRSIRQGPGEPSCVPRGRCPPVRKMRLLASLQAGVVVPGLDYVGRKCKGELMPLLIAAAKLMLTWWFILIAIILFIVMCWPIARPLLLTVAAWLLFLVSAVAWVFRIRFLDAWLDPLAKWMYEDSKRDV